MTPAFSPLTLEDLAAIQIPELEYVVDGLLPDASLTLFSAREKTGKGLMTVDLCVSVAFEEPFLGRATLGGPAIYIAAEESIGLVRDRAFTRAGDRRDKNFLVLPLNGFTDDRLRLDDPDSMQRLQNMMREHEPRVIVIDTLREVHDRAENDSDEMGPLIRPLRQLSHADRCSIVLNHHQNRQNSFRGSTAILAACDQEWNLQRTDGEDSTVPTGTLFVMGRFGPKVVVHVRFPEGGRGRWEVTDAPTVFGESGLAVRIIAALRGAGRPVTVREIYGMLTPQPELKTVQNAVSSMINRKPAALASVGLGKKNDPRRFLPIDPELPMLGEAADDSFPTDDRRV